MSAALIGILSFMCIQIQCKYMNNKQSRKY